MDSRPLEIVAADGVVLGGHWWTSQAAEPHGTVIVNAATGVLARYYHRFAAFLAGHGFNVLTYDYRGIGLSRPARLRGCGHTWRQWGELDTDAVIRFALERHPELPLSIVGHSIGGFLPGYAESASRIDRMLTVGAQYAYWRDYGEEDRLGLWLKWHLAMPALTAVFGYFPGKALGWLEDLPAGVANEWSFRGARFERSHPEEDRKAILATFASVAAPILAISMTDDEFATRPAVRRALDYYRGATPTKVMLEPGDFGLPVIGHFDLFHSRHEAGFWLDTLLWLRDGVNPWPHRRYD